MKRNYLLSLIVIGLISLSLYSTYAMFTASVETDDIVNLTASTLPTSTEIVEYERIIVEKNSEKTIEFTIKNSTSKILYYGTWYEMIKPSSINDSTVVARQEESEKETLGQLNSSETAKVSLIVKNNTSSDIIVNLGVGYGTTSSLNLPENRNLITDVYKEGILASEYIESLLPSNKDTMNNDDPDHNVRYMGKDPDNYVWFNNELWRIIGVFNVKSSENGKLEKRLKIIRNESLGMVWDTANSNNWAKASLQTYLNGEYYNSLTPKAKGQVGDTYWNIGGSSTYNDVTASMFYERERGTITYNNQPATWVGKIGLMYPSDYGYATSGGKITNRVSCLTKQLYGWDSSSYSDCKNNDYLYNSHFFQWTISSFSIKPNQVFNIYSSGNISRDSANTTENLISPVLCL